MKLKKIYFEQYVGSIANKLEMCVQNFKLNETLSNLSYTARLSFS